MGLVETILDAYETTEEALELAPQYPSHAGGRAEEAETKRNSSATGC